MPSQAQRLVTSPRVSVLVTTHNGASTIRESIASVLVQDMTDFDLVVVDDASDDNTPAIVASFGDPRIVLVRSDVRRGIAEARNYGLARCRGAYIAALDHDDLSDPRRLGLQAAYLDVNTDVVLVATRVRELRDGRFRTEDQPRKTSPLLLRLLLHLDNPLAWSSIMLRADALRKIEGPPLRSAFEPADDFDLYHRLLKVGDIARLDMPLTTYRWHAGNASRTARASMVDRAVRVLTCAYRGWFGTDAARAAALVIRHSCERTPVTDIYTLAQLHRIVGCVAHRLAQTYPQELQVIETGARATLWRLTRAGVRAGRPLLFRPPAPPLDAAVSIGVGMARAAFQRRRDNG